VAAVQKVVEYKECSINAVATVQRNNHCAPAMRECNSARRWKREEEVQFERTHLEACHGDLHVRACSSHLLELLELDANARVISG
jgi:hypothetical protein